MTASALDRHLLGHEELAGAAAALDGGGAAAITLARPAWPWVLAALRRAAGRPMLAVAPGDEEARDVARELEALLGTAAVALWPTLGAPSGGVGLAPHLVGQRARARNGLGRSDRLAVVSGAALAELAPLDVPQPVTVEVGTSCELDLLADQLAGAGYERVAQVEERGEFAVRGGILDVYGTTAAMPARVELFGDEVESLRAFSAFTQRTVRPVRRLTAWPAREAGEVPLGLVTDGLAGVSVVRLAPAEHARELAEAAERLEDEAAEGALAPAGAVLDALAGVVALDVEVPRGGVRPVFDAVEARFATRGASEAEAELTRLARNGQRVVVAFERRGEMERTRARLERVVPEVVEPDALPAPGEVAFTVSPVRRGFLSRALGLALIPGGALFRRRRPGGDRPVLPGRHLRSFLDLRVGDHIVHEDHGVGRLVAFETRTVAQVTRDYLALAFAGGDRLYVPHDQLHHITRYVGADGSDPTLSKLGGKAWDRLKSRARAAVRELAGELIALYEARARAEGHSFPPEDELTREMERRFQHTETPDQQRAIDAVMDDMERPRPMDRLVCGDVGFGKTEIAMRAAFRAAAAGKQVMVLAPTTILAQQHLATFRERYADLPVSVDMVNRFRSAADTRKIMAQFREGSLDVLIGTHRLLGMDVQPKDLGLVVVDEEQRFGVAQKEALRKLRVRVDVLAMSATPIPRTLQMSLSGLRDISVIETPPGGRRPVATHVGEYDDELVRQALEREAERDGQAFVLHNRVETIEEAAERVRALVPDLQVVVAHGQMPEGELEDVMLGFVRGDGDVLVSTSIIESGLDIPAANTLVVERSDQLGLSQLHQIRGRVGRSDALAHAYLLYPDAEALTRESAARLRALADYTELGSGLRIAMRDLEIRGAGNLLGDEQSGHVAAVGFELYVEMLQEAVALQEGTGAPEAEPRVEIPASAYIPADYVPFEAAKIDVHRRIAQASDLAALEALADELQDRFGPLPDPVAALLALQRVRVKLRTAGADHVSARGGRVTVAPVRLTSAGLTALRESLPRAVYSGREGTVAVPADGAPTDRLRAAEETLDALGAATAAAASAG